MVQHHRHRRRHHHRGGGIFLHVEDEDDYDDVIVHVDDDDDDDDDGKMFSLLDRGEIATITVPTSSSIYPQHKRGMNPNNYNDGYYYYYSDTNNNNYYYHPTCDTTTSHIQMGRIILPIQMNLPLPDNDSVSSMTKNEVTLPPFYSVGKTSRISLVAAYPPPFPATSNPNHMRKTTLVDDDDDDDDDQGNTAQHQQQRLLQRYSGWYGTTSIHSATTDITTNEPMLQPSQYGSLGYAESTISLNYRCPFFVVVPSLLSPLSFNDVIQDYGIMNNVKGERRLRQHHYRQQQQHRKGRSSQRRQLLITDLHCTMHLGPSITSSSSAINNNNHHSILPSIGTTLSTPNGRSQLRFDAAWSNAWLQWGRTRAKAQRRTADRKHEYYTVCASHDFCHQQEDGPSQSASSYYCRLFPPLRTQCAMRLLPYQALHSQNFLLTVSTINKDSLGANNHEIGNGNANYRYDSRCRGDRPRPDMTLCLGYGAPPSSFISAGEILLNGANIIDYGDSVSMPNDFYFCAPFNNVDSQYAVAVIPSSFIYSSGNLKLTVDQQLLSSSKASSIWHGSIEYLHAGRVLTFGTMLTRSFATSKFSRLGVGIQQSIIGNVLQKNIDDNSNGVSVRNPWWWRRWWCRWWAEAGYSTSWLFQLERGGVRLLVPMTFSGGSNMIVSSWRTSLLGLFYASLASIIVDVIVCELLCGMTSRLRIGLLRLLLGEKCAGDTAAGAAGDREGSSCRRDENGDHYEQWLDEQLSHAKEEALRQVNLMARQAQATTKKEEEMGGLVIVNAMYGVMDNKNRRWLSRRRNRRDVREDAAGMSNHISNNTQDYHAMDATTQLQFWIANSTLRLPKLSKRHLLGFYDVLAYIGDDGWVEIEENEGGSESSHCITITPAATSFTRILEKWWKGAPCFVYESKTRRELTVRLSIRYKFEDKVFDVSFDDDQAVELPCRFANEVHLPLK